MPNQRSGAVVAAAGLQAERTGHTGQLARLVLQSGRGGRGFFHQRRVLLRHRVQVRHCLIDLHNAGKRLVEDAYAIDIPTLVLSADKDYVVKTKAQKQFFVRLESECKEFILLKDFYHGVLFEKDRHIVYDHILRFAKKSLD